MGALSRISPRNLGLKLGLVYKEKPVLQLWRNCFIYSSGTFYLYTNHLLFSITTLQRSPRWFLLDLAQLFAYSWPLGLLRVVQLQLLLSAKINKALINTKPEEVRGICASMNSTFGLLAAYRKHLPANWACEKAYECMGYRIKPRATLLDQQCWELLRVGSGLQTDARTPSYHCWPIARSYCFAVSKETMCKARAWFQQCWKSCANGSNIVALHFSDHGTKEISGQYQLTALKQHAQTPRYG